MHESARGTVSAVQTAVCQLFTLLVSLQGLVFHDPAQFHILIWCSLGTVFAAATIFSMWATAQQGEDGGLAGGDDGGGDGNIALRGKGGNCGDAQLSENVVHLQAKTKVLEHRLAHVEMLLREATAGKSPQKSPQLTGL